MKSLIQTLSLCGLFLATPVARCTELPAGMAETFQDYLRNSKHVVLVCEVQLTLEEPPTPRTKYRLHVSATVVRPIQGQGRTGDRLKYYILLEDKPPAKALSPGGLKYLFLDEYGLDEFLLDTGAGWRYQPALEALLHPRPENPKTK